MYKLIEPFEYDKIYNYHDKKYVLKQIYKDLKYYNTNNIKIRIKDIKTGKNYTYFIINQKKNKVKI